MCPPAPSTICNAGRFARCFASAAVVLERSLHRGRQLGFGGNERGREQDVVTIAAVHGAAHVRAAEVERGAPIGKCALSVIAHDQHCVGTFRSQLILHLLLQCGIARPHVERRARALKRPVSAIGEYRVSPHRDEIAMRLRRDELRELDGRQADDRICRGRARPSRARGSRTVGRLFAAAARQDGTEDDEHGSTVSPQDAGH